VQIGIDELRGLITELRPASLDELGTPPAPAALAERIVATTGCRSIWRSTSRARPAARRPGTRQLESTLRRFVQDLLTNAVKHADASRVAIEVEEDDHAVHVGVRDDGIGLEPADAGEGFGLLGTRERVALAGGTLQVASRPGDGTTVTSEIPVRRRAAGEARPGRAATEPAA
jgi:two-component system, NarL family, sensor histidine kinase DevS